MGRGESQLSVTMKSYQYFGNRLIPSLRLRKSQKNFLSDAEQH
ncbi:hypothetical protein SAMN05216388_105216 [Halorientalis persicus]|uniref:Uncharacterized protein n=1 Tax=Halorientalis persicus TaxID=1367881 RepID=A0A1H8W9F3_9EURY|nr:hypothetical protein SAMN05216388_105216 [Halorientalis persicus]